MARTSEKSQEDVGSAFRDHRSAVGQSRIPPGRQRRAGLSISREPPAISLSGAVPLMWAARMPRRSQWRTPTSTTVGVTRFAGPDFTIEIEAVAVVNS
jgi:hypothetical protein